MSGSTLVFLTGVKESKLHLVIQIFNECSVFALGRLLSYVLELQLLAGLLLRFPINSGALLSCGGNRISIQDAMTLNQQFQA